MPVSHSGKSITQISLPCTFFEARSTLYRELEYFRATPLLVRPEQTEGETEDSILSDFYAVCAYVVAGLHRFGGARKAFNPILGETLQCSLSDGTACYASQPSHHPPVTQVLLDSPSFRVHGCAELYAKMKGKTVGVKQIGTFTVELKGRGPGGAKRVYTYTIPDALTTGVTGGDKYTRYTSECVVYDAANGLECVIAFPNRKKGSADEIEGAVHRVADTGVREAYYATKESKRKDKQRVAYQGGSGPVSVLTGNWLSHLHVSVEGVDTLLWERKGMDLPTIEPREGERETLLPSDGMFRPDVTALGEGDMEAAQVAKEAGENGQRRDRRLRNGTEPETPSQK
ncbi:oxysterol-binding protein [Kipferlia bialata]|uniref:Oxysterol-binding protein n=1 Tax=Kipferlia bialata TaxID=797122 RepID=A0A9K3CY13_9EUKA|nr:oxysterol-binding protein [Kipferlia bialata]|eukprot:g5880.t1